jgi:hypothetical protein
MRRILMTALGGVAVAAATPAYADLGPIVDPCSSGFVTGAIACQGYYGQNLITGAAGSATTADELAAINLLLNGTASTADTLPTNNTAGYNPPYSLDYDTVLAALSNLNGTSTLTFSTITLSGLTVLGAHFGNNIDSDVNNVTAFWLVNVTDPHTITLANGQGSSNAQIFATGGAVPEPATWAMMLLGFGGIGMAMRRGRKQNERLLQIA